MLLVSIKNERIEMTLTWCQHRQRGIKQAPTAQFVSDVVDKFNWCIVRFFEHILSLTPTPRIVGLMFANSSNSEKNKRTKLCMNIVFMPCYNDREAKLDANLYHYFIIFIARQHTDADARYCQY